MIIDDKKMTIAEDEDEILVEVEENKNDDGENQEDDPVEALRVELDKAKRERDEVSVRFREAEAQRARFEMEARLRGEGEMSSQKALIEHAIIAEQSRAELAENAYAEALSAGNYAEAAKVQRAMAQSEARLSQLQAGLDQISRNIETKNSRTQEQKPANDVESYIGRFTQQSQTWLRKHRDDIFSSESRGNMAYAGHVMAVNNGIVPDSDEYFDFLDRHMGYSSEKNATEKNSGAIQRKTTPAAPPSRNTVLTQSKTQIPLTPEERNLAADLGMTVKEYAEYKRDIASGKTNLHFSKEGVAQ